VFEDLVCGNGQEVGKVVGERHFGEQVSGFFEPSSVVYVVAEFSSKPVGFLVCDLVHVCGRDQIPLNC